jgi:hypothetical protein
MNRLVLNPRWSRSGHVYDVLYGQQPLVTGSSDPEHAAARALLTRGITGVAETLDAANGAVRMRFNLEEFAAARTVERAAGGLSVEPFRSHGPDSSHVLPPAAALPCEDVREAPQWERGFSADRGKLHAHPGLDAGCVAGSDAQPPRGRR